MFFNRVAKKCFQACLKMCMDKGLASSTCYRYRKWATTKDYIWPKHHGSKGGKKRLQSFPAMAEWKKQFAKGQVFTNQDVKDRVKKMTGKSPCKNTVGVYFEELVQDPNAKCRKYKKVYHKTERRFIAEHSRRAVVTLCVITGLTHAVPTDDPERKCTKTELDKMIPYPHHWADPNLMFNNDDTTYVAAALKSGETAVYAAPNADASGAYSVFTLDKKVQNFYQRIKAHCTCSFSGILGPFILSTKIKEREWGNVNRDIIVMTIPGLCTGGDLAPLTEPGYLVLLKQGRTELQNETLEQKLTRWMFEQVWIPYIERIRGRVDPAYQAGDDPPSWLTAIWWFDGHIPPLKAVTSRDLINKLVALRIIPNKGNPGRTGVEQLWDVCDVFKRSKHWVKKGTAPPATFAMLKQTTTEIFTRYHKEHGLRIAAKKRNLIIDFVAQYPAVVRKSFTSESLLKAVKRVGKYCPVSGQPDFLQLIRTIPGNLTELEEFSLLDAAQRLMASGRGLDICEDDLERAGVPPDKNSLGEVVPRDFSLKQEWRQRSKCCSTDVQREGREKLVQAALLAEEAAKLKKSGTKLKIIRENADAEAHLKQICSADGILCRGNHRRMYHSATMEHFAKLRAPELRAFIFARKYELRVKFKLNKLNVQAAQRGEACTILTAFELRLNKVTLTAPAVQPASVVPLLAVNDLVHSLADDALVIQNREYAIAKIAANTVYTAAWADLINDALPQGVVSLSGQEPALEHLEKQLRQRLCRHIQNRIPEGKKKLRSSHVWDFVRMNLQRVAMVLIQTGHVLPSDVLVHVRGVCKCLLAPATSERLMQLRPDVPLFNAGEGVYLYWDPVNAVWVRSGKISGRPFSRRHDEHLRSARAGNTVSGFYAAHASEQCNDHVAGVWTGVPFEKLQMYAGVSWTREKARSIIDLLWWPDETMTAMKRSTKWRGDGTEYRVDFAAYLFELGYDLLLEQANCPSEGPGFEGPLGFHS